MKTKNQIKKDLYIKGIKNQKLSKIVALGILILLICNANVLSEIYTSLHIQHNTDVLSKILADMHVVGIVTTIVLLYMIFPSLITVNYDAKKAKLKDELENKRKQRDRMEIEEEESDSWFVYKADLDEEILILETKLEQMGE